MESRESSDNLPSNPLVEASRPHRHAGAVAPDGKRGALALGPGNRGGGGGVVIYSRGDYSVTPVTPPSVQIAL